ncbi:MAG: DUF4276 family protein [Anaerolineae bacterium]|jgi:hypothetical protein|nr:DUF4276 family protein [Anaerolineae bacterium]
MRQIFILVEGQTEESFCSDVLNPVLSAKNLFLSPTIVTTSRPQGRPQNKGGYVSYTKMADQIRKLLNASQAVAVTSMFDFYGLSKDFPGLKDLPKGTCYKRAQQLQQNFAQDIADPRFIPFLTLHDFEALLFTNTDEIIKRFPDASKQQIAKIKAIKFTSPEEINEQGPEFSAGNRLKTIFPAYQKPQHGILIAKAIGLENIRTACPHFNVWVDTLEAI